MTQNILIGLVDQVLGTGHPGSKAILTAGKIAT